MTYTEPTAIGGMTQEELDKELRKGIESIKEGKTFTAGQLPSRINGLHLRPLTPIDIAI